MKRRTSRLLSILLALCMMLLLLPGTAWAVEDTNRSNAKFVLPVSPIVEVPKGYTGIYTAADLNNIRNDLSGNYILMNDIDLSSWGGWDSINGVFEGILDGNGHTISGLVQTQYISSEEDTLTMGLFTEISGTVKNLCMEKAMIKSTAAGSTVNIGIIAGKTNNGKINNCVITDSEISIDTYKTAYVGGLIGGTSGSYGNILNCINGTNIYLTDNFADKFGSYVHAGGIVGVSYSEIDSCVNQGNIILEGIDDGHTYYVGGIVGETADVSKCANYGNIDVMYEAIGSGYSVSNEGYVGGITGLGRYIYNSYNVGIISGDINVVNSSGIAIAYLYMGGIMGYQGGGQYSQILNCYNRGILTSTANATGDKEKNEHIVGDAGEIVGYSYSLNRTNLIQYCYFANLTSNEIVGGVVNGITIQDSGPLSDAQMKEQNNFAGFDFDSVWTMGTGNYPYPILQVLAQLPTGSDPEPSVPPTNENMAFVQEVTETSLKYADSETKGTINNAIYNLLFKAQFRPNKNEINDVDFGSWSDSLTQKEVNVSCWPARNTPKSVPAAKTIKDDVLGNVEFKNYSGVQYSSKGCLAYAYFASRYVYGSVLEIKRSCSSNANDIEEMINNYIDPGEHIREEKTYIVQTAEGPVTKISAHSVVFLGYGQAGDGFYFTDYSDSSGTNPSIRVGYYTFDAFAEKYSGYRIYAFDTNGGSFLKGTATSAAELRENHNLSRIVARLDCPVEATITLGNSVLDSRIVGDGISHSTDFGTVIRNAETITFDLDYRDGYEFRILGTAVGEMTLTLEYYSDDELIDIRTFVSVPITSETQIETTPFNSQCTFLLFVDGQDGDLAEIWSAGTGETVYKPDDVFNSECTVDDENVFAETYTVSFIGDGITDAVWTVEEGEEIRVNPEFCVNALEGAK